MHSIRKIMIYAAVVLFMAWCIKNSLIFKFDDDGILRLVLSLVFSLLILFRTKTGHNIEPRAWLSTVTGVVGILLSLTGIIFVIHQFEWVGTLFLLYSCLSWAFPQRYRKDILLALFILYWAHPLPGRLFNSFQLIMQTVSVQGAEWLLHCLNMRVWADYMTITTGVRDFVVTQDCSGMHTSVTVVLCGLGIGILFRFRWYETIILMMGSVAQVLLINILRIGFLVYWSQRMPLEWGITYLHDTLGMFLLVSIILVQVEASIWKAWKIKRQKTEKAIHEQELEEPERASPLPVFWQYFSRWFYRIALSVILILGIAFAIYKNRPKHRIAMVSEVVDSMMNNKAKHASAEVAISQLLAKKPQDRELIDKKIRILMLRKKHQKVIDEFINLPPPYNIDEVAMKSWALMSLGRTQEAIMLINGLSAEEKLLPGIAIIKAQYSAIVNNPAEVIRNVSIAAGSIMTLDRIRSLFPYLARHEQWKTIVDSDNRDIPYDNIVEAVIAVQANLKLDRVQEAAEVVKKALEQWPDDPKLLNSLFFITVRRPGGDWEQLYTQNFMKNIAKLDADGIAIQMNYCMRINRPDLAWLAFTALKKKNPTDPSLYLIPAKYGGSWFTIRCQQIGVSTHNKEEMIDLRPLCALTRDVEPFKSFWDIVPLAGELASKSSDEIRAAMLKKGLELVKEYERAGRLTERMEMIYPSALAMSGDYASAHRKLDEIEKRFPLRKREILLEHADFYHAENRWQESYEALREYMVSIDQPDLQSTLNIIDNLMNLNLGICAYDTAVKALKQFPGAWQLNTAISSIWDIYGFKDQALFVLGYEGRKDYINYTRRARLLYETGRMDEAKRISMAYGLSMATNRASVLPVMMPKAELTVSNRWPKALSNEQMISEAEAIEKELGKATSPFFKGLLNNSAVFYRNGGISTGIDFEKWAEVGRDEMEKAGALHRLGVMLAIQGDSAGARKAIEAAILRMPKSPVLWRIMVVLTNGDGAVIKQAREACPDDPEIWLASIVVFSENDKDGKWIVKELQTVIAEKTYSVETIIRAGEYFLRKRHIKEACIAAKYAQKNSEGLFFAEMLAMACALATKDIDWALEAAIKGAKIAPEPSPFFEVIAVLKSVRHKYDSDVMEALEYLRKKVPVNVKWIERYGDIYFEKGDMTRASSILGPLVDKDMKNIAVRSLLIAAEAARAEGHLSKAVKMLESAMVIYPDRLSILNNLVYYLAEDPKTLSKAVELLPVLIAKNNDSFVVADTIAKVYMKNGRLDMARKYMDKALKALDVDEYSALEVKLNYAELLVAMNNFDAASVKIADVEKDKAISHHLSMKAKDLRQKIKEKSNLRIYSE